MSDCICLVTDETFFGNKQMFYNNNSLNFMILHDMKMKRFHCCQNMSLVVEHPAIWKVSCALQCSLRIQVPVVYGMGRKRTRITKDLDEAGERKPILTLSTSYDWLKLHIDLLWHCLKTWSSQLISYLSRHQLVTFIKFIVKPLLLYYTSCLIFILVAYLFIYSNISVMMMSTHQWCHRDQSLFERHVKRDKQP